MRGRGVGVKQKARRGEICYGFAATTGATGALVVTRPGRAHSHPPYRATVFAMHGRPVAVNLKCYAVRSCYRVALYPQKSRWRLGSAVVVHPPCRAALSAGADSPSSKCAMRFAATTGDRTPGGD